MNNEWAKSNDAPNDAYFFITVSHYNGRGQVLLPEESETQYILVTINMNVEDLKFSQVTSRITS